MAYVDLRIEFTEEQLIPNEPPLLSISRISRISTDASDEVLDNEATSLAQSDFGHSEFVEAIFEALTGETTEFSD